MFKYTLLVISFASIVYCADILAIIPTPSFSHQVAFFDFWRELSLKGHHVTVITTDPQRNENLTNLTEIDISATYRFLHDISDDAENSMTMWNFHNWLNHMWHDIDEAILSFPEVQDLIHNKNKRFDVILVESFHLELLAFSEIFNCPTILVSSLDTLSYIHDAMGNSKHPVLNPELNSNFHPPLEFKDRVLSTIHSAYVHLFYNYISHSYREENVRRFFNSTSTLNELLNKVDMLFLTVNPVVQPVRAIGPTTVNVGGMRSISPKPLPLELLEFLNNATTGFVYFSLGSNVKSKDLQKESLDAIVETLGELPYKVLWKFETDADAVIRKPDNVKLIKWAPQLGVLAHPNLKVFVTQGGLQSMEESIHNEVPTVVIPFFGDQQQNAKLMQSKGISVTVGRHPYIMKEELKSAILEVINNPSYKDSVSKLKRLALDTPMSGLEKAIWWTEYVIRNKGAKHLRNPAADLPVYQYYLLDVIGFLVAVSIVMISIVVFLFRRIYSLAIALVSLGKRSDFHKKSQ